MVSKSMLGSLLQKQLTYTPQPQPLYNFRNGTWRSSQQPVLPAPTNPVDAPLKSLYLITWNIDFMASYPRARMESALAYMETLVAVIPSSSAVVIFLQEMMESANLGKDVDQNANDLSQLAGAAWVQQRFNITDIDSANWNSPYGVVTLVDRRLSTAQVSRLRFVSEYQRDALLVDVHLASGDGNLFRLCNVHLDSSYGPMRPIQWKAVAKHLQNGGNGIVASILAGDCNANQPRDRTEPQENRFKDAYLELGGEEGGEEGATWGFQSVDYARWGRQRLDKQVFWGEVSVKSLEKIGVGVKVESERVTRQLEECNKLPFATDHYGLMGRYETEDAFKTFSYDEAI